MPWTHPHLRFCLLATVACLALPLTACADRVGEAGAAEAAHAAATGEEVVIHEDGATVSYRTPDGELTMTGGQAASLPVDFPGDIFLPDAYVVESTLAMNEDLFIAFGVEQDVPSLYAAARKDMAGHGWTETMAALENSENGLLTFEKDDRAVVLSLAREGDGATLGLQITRVAR